LDSQAVPERKKYSDLSGNGEFKSRIQLLDRCFWGCHDYTNTVAEISMTLPGKYDGPRHL